MIAEAERKRHGLKPDATRFFDARRLADAFGARQTTKNDGLPYERLAELEKTSERERGGVIGWLVMSFLFVFVLLVVGGIFFVHSIKVRESGSGKDVQVDTPFGSVHVSQNQAGQTGGMAVYPGAKPVKDNNSAVVDLSSAFGDKDLHIVAGKWRTSDPIDKVEKYYEDKFPDMSVIQHSGRVDMHSVNGNGKRVIALVDRGGSTEITLASVGEPKAN